jgi:hypothetical protein
MFVLISICILCYIHSLIPYGPQIVLVDDRECPVGRNDQGDALSTPVDLELDWVLGKMPQKVCGICFFCSLLCRSPLTLPVLCYLCVHRALDAHTPVTVSVAGVLPPEGVSCAAASGLAPWSERTPST